MTRGIWRGLARAMACHRSGRVAEADRLYGELIERAPENPDAGCRPGCLARQRGEGMAEAARLIEAIRFQPENPAFHYTLPGVLGTTLETIPAAVPVCGRMNGCTLGRQPRSGRGGSGRHGPATRRIRAIASRRLNWGRIRAAGGSGMVQPAHWRQGLRGGARPRLAARDLQSNGRGGGSSVSARPGDLGGQHAGSPGRCAGQAGVDAVGAGGRLAPASGPRGAEAIGREWRRKSAALREGAIQVPPGRADEHS